MDGSGWGSTEGTVAMLEKHAAVIDGWESESDKGMYDAMYKGTGSAYGDVSEWLTARRGTIAAA